MSDGKTFDGMRKIFELTDLLPAEIMYNGNADFENFSMETLISKFKNTVDFEELKTVENVKNKFIKFLSLNTQFTDINEYLKDILGHFKDDLIFKIDSEGFDNVMGNARRREIPTFVKNYSELKEYVFKSNSVVIENITRLLEKENIDDIDKIIDICNIVLNEGYSDLNEFITNYKMSAIEFTSFSIEYLPRWLLCDLADYLIQLTALKQKISSEIESVSIEADVTLMTKYDGLKWVKSNYERV